MSGDCKRDTVVKSGIVILGIVAVAAVAYSWWTSWQEKQTDTGPDGKKESAGATCPVDSQPKTPNPLDLKNTSASETLDLLREIRTNQKQMTQLLDRTVEKIAKNKLSVLETYQTILDEQPADPLETHGLSIQDFDSLLERFSSDKAITNMVMEILQGGETGPSEVSASNSEFSTKKEITVEDIIKINSAMCTELRAAVEEFERLTENTIPNLDTRAASVAAQAIVGAFISTTFNLTPEDVEIAISKHQDELKSNDSFFKLNMEIQSTMNRLVSRMT